MLQDVLENSNGHQFAEHICLDLIEDGILFKGVARPSDGHTPLHSAAQVGSTVVAEALLEKGIGVDIQTLYGETALKLACMRRKRGVIDQLIEVGSCSS